VKSWSESENITHCFTHRQYCNLIQSECNLNKDIDLICLPKLGSVHFQTSSLTSLWLDAIDIAFSLEAASASVGICPG